MVNLKIANNLIEINRIAEEARMASLAETVGLRADCVDVSPCFLPVSSLL